MIVFMSDQNDGQIIPIWKPIGPTSHDMINKVRKITGIKKVGHAGTLDPLAEGVLVVGIGRSATRKLASIVAKEKEYLAYIKLGATTDTYDREGKLSPCSITTKPSIEDVTRVLNESFTGQIKQIPPPFSAIKVKGKPAYLKARKGEKLALKPRDALIKNIEIINFKWPDLTLRVITGPGVYIRSLAYDLGEELQTGGYLHGLKRIRVGQYTENMAIEIKDLPGLLKKTNK